MSNDDWTNVLVNAHYAPKSFYKGQMGQPVKIRTAGIHALHLFGFPMWHIAEITEFTVDTVKAHLKREPEELILANIVNSLINFFGIKKLVGKLRDNPYIALLEDVRVVLAVMDITRGGVLDYRAEKTIRDRASSALDKIMSLAYDKYLPI